MLKQELKQHYIDTAYIININDKKYNIYINQVPPIEIQHHIHSSKEKTGAIITAWNPLSKLLSEEENNKRNKKLHDSILDYTFLYALGQGANSSWPAEKSFLILGIDKESAEKLAVKYEQNAYIWLENNQLASLVFTRLWID